MRLFSVVVLVVLCSPVLAVQRGTTRPSPPAPGRLENLERMSPDERQKMLDRLSPERARRLREQLDQYDRMPEDQRERVKRQYQWFERLPPERQEALRNVFQRYSNLPPGRRSAVHQEYATLKAMSEAGRRARLDSREFRTRYSREERKLIQEMSRAAPD